ncbi:MAG: sigma-70 family RNA polymerase sigma factor, partial [Bacteroidota bacterium]
LLLRIRRGESKAVKELYEQTFDSSARVVLRDGGSFQDAEEVFQEAVFSLMIKLERPEFRVRSSLKSYLSQSCFNIWVKTKRAQRLLQDLEITPLNQLVSEDNVDALTEKEQRFLQMEACLDKASAACQRLLRLTFFEKKSDEEIAPILNYSKQFVKNKRRRCMEALRKCMGIK